jgi:hypothetical protein
LKKLLFLSALIGVVSYYVMAATLPVHASFNQNNLISDVVFNNSGTMSAAAIDNWLNSNYPNSCISTNNDFTAPDPTGYSPSTGFRYGGAVSAGRVISDASQAYDINPQVLITTLEKESSVVSGNAPYHCQYMNTSMGFDCPDSGACPLHPETESGFSQQIIHAAWLLKYSQQRSLGNVNFNIQKPGWDNSDDPPSCYAHLMTQGNRARSASSSPCPTGSSPPGNQVNYYDGYTTIDGTTVHLDTGATAALYDYTPHFHGNENFVSIFEDTFHFGSTQAVPGGWQLVDQGLYLDSGHTVPANPNVMSANTTYYLKVVMKNMSNTTWTNSGSNPVTLGTFNPQDRRSAFCDNSWISFNGGCNRAALLKEASVVPESNGTFEFSIKTPNNFGVYKEYFRPVTEGQAWMADLGLFWQFNVKPPTAAWSLVSQDITYDSGNTSIANTDALAPNTTYYIRVVARNDGNTTWTNSGSNPVDLGTSSPQDRNSAFCDQTWLSCNRPARLNEASVAPGQTGTFSFSIKTPSSTGSFKEYFRPVVEGSMWMNDIGMFWQFNVRSPIAVWQYAGQNTYTNNSKATPVNISTLANGTSFYAVVSARNIGNTTWTNSGSNPVDLGTSSPQDRNSAFCDQTWLSCNRPARLNEASVAPGQTGTFSFWMQAPYSVNGTTLKEYFRPVVEGSMWMNDLGMYWQTNMQSSTTSWQDLDQTAYSDSSHNTPVDPANLQTNKTYYFQVKTKNTSGVTWNQGGSYPTRLGTYNPQDRSSVFCDSTTWVNCSRPAKLSESSVAPGQTGTFNFTIKTPSTATSSKEYFRLVTDNLAWLDDLGMYWQISAN